MSLTRNRPARIHTAHCRCRACRAPRGLLLRAQAAPWASYRAPIIVAALAIAAAASGWSIWTCAIWGAAR